MELLRVLFSSLDFVFVDAGGGSPIVAGGVALGVGLVGLVAPLFARRSWMLVVALAASRLAVQIAAAPVADLWWSAAGVAMFAAALVTVAGWRSDAVVGVMFGVLADRALMGALGTIDVAFRQGVRPIIGVAVAGSSVAVAGAVVGRSATRSGGHTVSKALLGFGPWLALELLVFGNIGLIGSLTGLPLRGAAMLATFSGVVTLLGAIASLRNPRRFGGLAALLLVITLGTVSGFAGVWAGLDLLLASIAFGMLLPGLFRPEGSGGGLWLALGILVLFAYYATYNYPTGYRSALVLPVAAGLLAASALGPVKKPADLPFRWGWAGIGLVIALLPMIGHNPRPVAGHVPAGDRTVRIMTYNLHQGFAVDGHFSLEEIARVIEASGADVVALQEVQRGWVTDGEVDMAAWLSQRLRMAVVSGPTADRQWGNALLSRYPIVGVTVHRLPRDRLALRRGLIDVSLQVGQSDLRVIVTHFHHVDADDAVRVEEAHALIDLWDGSEETIIAGDLNAVPSDQAIRVLDSAGLVDAAAEKVVATSPADNPRRRIDYVWSSPDLVVESAAVVETTASDHLPVVVTVRLPDRPPR